MNYETYCSSKQVSLCRLKETGFQLTDQIVLSVRLLSNTRLYVVKDALEEAHVVKHIFVEATQAETSIHNWTCSCGTNDACCHIDSVRSLWDCPSVWIQELSK